jgi:hypothetical protein
VIRKQLNINELHPLCCFVNTQDQYCSCTLSARYSLRNRFSNSASKAEENNWLLCSLLLIQSSGHIRVYQMKHNSFMWCYFLYIRVALYLRIRSLCGKSSSSSSSSSSTCASKSIYVIRRRRVKGISYVHQSPSTFVVMETHQELSHL